MNLHMPVRIKAQNDFVSKLALSIVGGRYVDGAFPRFCFSSPVQRAEYERIRRDLQKKNDRCANSDHTPLK
ncbi:hypothetical protein J1TS5_26150 [Paenibacillus macerans]|uniref:hypothetical protein n=1 Tax=Paenibacillus macerans TaxID=44252 RepID=UPI001B242851|nr:hypothetical protein [Paenibacillus macerans]GIP10445.1 hypothetical protein J1TS5_26150 [Paenibacillus macerans]